jgi:hypothetical protein
VRVDFSRTLAHPGNQPRQKIPAATTPNPKSVKYPVSDGGFLLAFLLSGGDFLAFLEKIIDGPFCPCCGTWSRPSFLDVADVVPRRQLRGDNAGKTP